MNINGKLIEDCTVEELYFAMMDIKRDPSNQSLAELLGIIEELETRENSVHINRHPSTVNHPKHYGGEDNVYEAIKVIDAWSLGFCLGNVIKYISRAEKKSSTLEDLEKARWYLDHEITIRGGKSWKPTS